MLMEANGCNGGDCGVSFVMRLCSLLHTYGTPAHRLEEIVGLVMRRLGVRGSIFSLPTGIWISIGSPEDLKTTLLRVEPGSVDLGKVSQLDELTNRVIAGEIDPATGLGRLDEILSAPSCYGRLLTALSFGLASGSSARFFGGGWRECLVSLLIGIAIGWLAILSDRSRTLSRVFDPVAAVFASGVAVLATEFLRPMSVYITTVASLIVLLPGLTLTIAMNELSTRNLVSGTARLMGAVVLFFEIGFGVALGTQLSKLLPHGNLLGQPRPLPDWTLWLALLVSPLALGILYRARPKDLGWVLLACVVAFLGARVGSSLLGQELGICIGAFSIGLAGNLFTRVISRPAVIPLVPGLTMLVPGSVGFKSLSEFLDQDVVSGVGAGFKMVLIAVALVTGLLLANVTVPARRAL